MDSPLFSRLRFAPILGKPRDDAVGCRSWRFFRSGDGACTLHLLSGLLSHSPPLTCALNLLVIGASSITSFSRRTRGSTAVSVIQDVINGPQVLFSKEQVAPFFTKPRDVAVSCRSSRFFRLGDPARVHYTLSAACRRIIHPYARSQRLGDRGFETPPYSPRQERQQTVS